MHSKTIKKPVVSIIIPCFNRAYSIKRAIDSSLSQTLKDVEVIVVDDCSTDGSLPAIRSFEDQVRLVCLGKNIGPSSARNLGLQIAKGEFVQFLDSDDYIESDSLENLVSSAQSSDITFGPFALEKSGKILKKTMPIATANPLDFSYNWVCGQSVPPCSVLWRRSFISAIGGWRDTALRNTDGEIVLRAMIMGVRFSFATAGIGIYCQHDSPDRVSKRSGRDILCNQIEIFESLFELAKSQNFDRFERVIGRAMYNVACEAFNHDVNDIGEHALAKARNLGFRGHAGGWRHRVSARAFGLRRKLQLARRVRSISNRLEPINRKDTVY